MAQMFPESPAHDSSSAETWLFEKLRNLNDDYFVLHSLGSMRHDSKSWSEIDFTVVGPEGVFFIEVKGGIVGRKNGEWQVLRGDGRTESLGRGPFSQVGGAEASTRRFLQNRHPWIREAVLGYWVITPECELRVDDLGVDQGCFYDATNMGIKANQLIANMRAYWMQRKVKHLVLGNEQIKEIVASLCADIPMIRSMRKDIDDVAHKIHVATVEQERVLTAAQTNPRLLIKGPAGSGKSSIALHEINRYSASGKRVLFSCSSASMSGRIAHIYRSNHLVSVLSSTEVLFRNRTEKQKYDVLIIDEGQDLLSQRLFDAYDSCLVGGVSVGVWRMFLDPFQAVLENGIGLEELFKKVGAPFELFLMDNVRTTTEIAVTASALGYVDHISGGISGPKVELIYSDHETDRQTVKDKINELIVLGFSRNEIMVIGMTDSDYWCSGVLNGIVSAYNDFDGHLGVTFSTASSVKGLETVAVILVGFSELESQQIRQSAYIGATRASTFLAVVAEKSLKPKFESAYAALAIRNFSR